MPFYFAPACNDQTIDANGDPLTGGQIETYLAGSSTPAATYTDSTGATPQSNPIILNSLGYPTLGSIWLSGGVAYKFIIKDAGGSTLRTIDNIVGVGDASVSLSEWVESGLVPTYISGTSFSVPGDQTPILQIDRRLRTTNTSGLVYSTIINSVFAAGITTVTLLNDSTPLDAGLSLVAYGLISTDNTSLPLIQTANIADEAVTFAKMQDVATQRFLGRVTTASGVIEELTPQQVVPMLTAKIQPITATVGSNALTITLNPTTIDFRSATLGSGTVNTRSVNSAISLVISSGSTLGTSNGVASRIAVLAIDNAGTVELAAINANGSTLDEAVLVSTTAEGGAGGADSGTVAYSTTARASVPYRIVGYIDSTQATAGTWATAPSTIQGMGGNLLSSLKGSLTAIGAPPVFAPRAWVVFDGSGAILAGGNVASVTKNATGNYFVNFTTNMPDANFCAQANSNANNAGGYVFSSAQCLEYATNRVRVSVSDFTATARDPSLCSVVVFR